MARAPLAAPLRQVLGSGQWCIGCSVRFAVCGHQFSSLAWSYRISKRFLKMLFTASLLGAHHEMVEK